MTIGYREAYQLLSEVEWAGRAAKAPYAMGGPTPGYVPMCPICRGVHPEQGRGEFRDEALGHKPGCRLRAVLDYPPAPEMDPRRMRGQRS